MRGEGTDLEPTNSKHSLSAAMSSEFLSSHFTFDEASSCCLNYKNSPMLVQREKREKKERERRQSSFTLRSYEVCIINFIVNFFMISQNLTRGNSKVERSKRWKCAYESKILAIVRVNALGIRKFHENALCSGKFQTRLWRIHPGVENPKSNPWKLNWQSKIPRIFPQSRTMSWLMCERVPNDEQRS